MDPLFFMDPHALFQAFLNSETTKHIYIGIAHLVNNPIELYYALYWSNSVRTTSGEYAHFVGGTDVGKAIFPSDFIYFQCFNNDDDCACYLLDDDHLLYIGRIKAVGKNYSTEYDYINYAGEITLIVQECITIDNIDDEFPGLGIMVQEEQDMEFKRNELVLRFE